MGVWLKLSVGSLSLIIMTHFSQFTVAKTPRRERRWRWQAQNLARPRGTS